MQPGYAQKRITCHFKRSDMLTASDAFTYAADRRTLKVILPIYSPQQILIPVNTTIYAANIACMATISRVHFAL
ncbi:MAG: hypothetical protein J7599_07015 [Niabella sp.]|nr:hypothetical protein [Niabella sp.]